MKQLVVLLDHDPMEWQVEALTVLVLESRPVDYVILGPCRSWCQPVQRMIQLLLPDSKVLIGRRVLQNMRSTMNQSQKVSRYDRPSFGEDRDFYVLQPGRADWSDLLLAGGPAIALMAGRHVQVDADFHRARGIVRTKRWAWVTAGGRISRRDQWLQWTKAS